MVKRIGIDIGGTNVRVGVFDELNLLQETRFHASFSQICKEAVAPQAWQTIMTNIQQGLEPAFTKYADIATVGIGFPGFIDPQTGVLAQSPNLPGLNNVNLQHDLTNLLGKKVTVFNDANAAAFGEYCLAGQPSEGLIYIGLGTGVGGGLVLQGRPYAGIHGCAMEVGHLTVVPNGRPCGCGNLGCLEQYASATGVALSYADVTQKSLSSADIANRAAQGDIHARAAFALAGKTLAQALAHIVKVVDVPNVVIGGGMAGAWPWLNPAFDERLQRYLIPVLRGKVQVRVSQAHDVAGMLGAALAAA